MLFNLSLAVVLTLISISKVNAQLNDSYPLFNVDPTWPTVPPEWRLGDVSSVAVDEQENIWILHRPKTLPAELSEMAAPPLIVFDSEGNFVNAWGGPGNAYEWPQNEHGLHIDDDGFVWITGNFCSDQNTDGQIITSDDQILKFTQGGELVMQIGKAGQNTGSQDTFNVHRAADLFVHSPTNELFVADGYGNRRVIVFDADTGAFKRQWGAFGELPGDRTPCGSPFGIEWVPEQFSIVHSIHVSNDGIVYVADREHSRIQLFTLEGGYIGEFVGDGGRIGSLGLSPDPAQQYLYANEEGKGTLILNRRTLELVTTINEEELEGPGHLIAIDSQNNLYRAGLFGGITKLTYSGTSSR